MEGKYIVNRAAGLSPLMKIEVWEDNCHCCQPKGVFPYNPSWWESQVMITKNSARNMSKTLDEALQKARILYNSLSSMRAPDDALVLGIRLD